MMTIEPLTLEDSIYVADNLRAEDKVEISAFGVNSVHKAMDYSYHMSTEAWSAKANGEPFVAFGVSPRSIVLGHGSPWLLGTDKILQHQIPFLRQSISYTDMMHNRYPYLSNYVYERNDVSKRWLGWLGFTIHEPMPLGLHGEKFHLFSRSTH